MSRKHQVQLPHGRMLGVLAMSGPPGSVVITVTGLPTEADAAFLLDQRAVIELIGVLIKELAQMEDDPE